MDVIAVSKAITFAARAEPALRLLLSGNPANIERVSRATGVDAEALAKTLVDEGLCAELTEEPAAGFGGGRRHQVVPRIADVYPGTF